MAHDDIMEEIRKRLKVVPVNKCLAHEGVVEKWVDQFSSVFKSAGMIKNPIIVAKHDDHWIVLDGMHRFSVFKLLEIKDILVYEVDYMSDEVRLAGWDAFTFKPIGSKKLLEDNFLTDGCKLVDCKTLQEAHDKVVSREWLVAVYDKGTEKVYGVSKNDLQGEKLLQKLICITEEIDNKIDTRDMRVIYVDDSLSIQNFEETKAQTIVIRPIFTKEEVLDHTITKKLFPRKSTRHMFPSRPLRVDFDLSILRANIPLEMKNELLQEHLMWCFETSKVRYYPESVYVFGD